MVAVCVGGRGRESLAMNLGMQAMAGDCGAWGWTCALHAIVGAMACIALLCNSIKGRIQSQKSCASRQHQNSTAFLFLSIVVLSSASTFARVRRRRSSLLATDSRCWPPAHKREENGHAAPPPARPRLNHASGAGAGPPQTRTVSLKLVGLSNSRQRAKGGDLARCLADARRAPKHVFRSTRPATADRGREQAGAAPAASRRVAQAGRPGSKARGPYL